MKTFWIATLTFFALSGTALGYDCGEFTPEQTLKIKNQLVLDVANDLLAPLENISHLKFSENFSISKGIRGNCEAIRANGVISFSIGSTCNAVGEFSGKTDAQEMETSLLCL